MKQDKALFDVIRQIDIRQYREVTEDEDQTHLVVIDCMYRSG